MDIASSFLSGEFGSFENVNFEITSIREQYYGKARSYGFESSWVDVICFKRVSDVPWYRALYGTYFSYPLRSKIPPPLPPDPILNPVVPNGWPGPGSVAPTTVPGQVPSAATLAETSRRFWMDPSVRRTVAFLDRYYTGIFDTIYRAELGDPDALDTVQEKALYAGMVPGPGDFIDVLNAWGYWLRGKRKEAILAGSGVILTGTTFFKRWVDDVAAGLVPSNAARGTAQTLGPEIVAQQALTRLQGKIQGGHFLTRHSPLVSRNDLYRRATQGITPEGVESYTTNATRFLRYTDMQEAIDKAVRSYQVGRYTGGRRIAIDLRRTVGEGYYKDTGTYGTTSKVIVGINQYGQPYTAFPVLP